MTPLFSSAHKGALTLVQGVFLAALMAMAQFASAQDDNSPLATDSVNWMYVLASGSATLKGNELGIDFEGQVFAFTDRPLRQSSRITVQQFVSFWQTENPLSFRSMPPNAVLTFADKTGGKDVQALMLLQLTEARLSGTQIIFTVKHMNPGMDTMNRQLSNVSLFID